jgi:RNA polymerase sigma-70 factor (ECF subfamily)
MTATQIRPSAEHAAPTTAPRRTSTKTAPAPQRTAPDPDRLSAALTGAQAGNQQAFRTLYQELHPHLLRQLRFSVGVTDAPDVASETWLHIVAGITDFHGTYSHFRSWATTIAQRRAVDHLRRTPPSDPTNPAAFPDLPAPDDTERDALEALATAAALSLVKLLPREQRKIILLRIIVGLDAPATARLLGKHPGAIRTGTHRALRTLANQLPQSFTAAAANTRARRGG